ncbi:MAG: hypothetical protein HQK92_13780 [Nitrospirae bacterium]|nr:hypothetical protein [Nitrospirota bacterium]
MKNPFNLKTAVFISILILQSGIVMASDNNTGVTVRQTVPSSETNFGEMKNTETPPTETQQRMIHKHGHPAPIKVKDNGTLND